MTGPRSGVRIGIDVGTVRIGVARSDESGLIAFPVETIDRRRGDDEALARIAELAAEHAAIEVLVGHPVSLSGRPTAAAAAAEAFARRIAEALPEVPVLLVDERLSSVSAQRNLHAAGRTHRNSRSVIDQAAAVIVVQQAIDCERSTGRPAGARVRREGR